MLTLAIGDLFIPDRALDLPAKFKKLLSPSPNSIPTNSKISQVICLGNVTNSLEVLKFLYNLSPSFNIVKGEYDDTSILSQQLAALSGGAPAVIPSYNIITHDNLRIGFTSGYQLVPRHDDMALSNLARELDVDILIWGGGCHKVEAYAIEGKFFINPGSASGAYTFNWPEGDKEEAEEEDEEEEEKEEEKEEVAAKEDKEDEKDKKEEEVKKDEETKNDDEKKEDDNEKLDEEAEAKNNELQNQDKQTEIEELKDKLEKSEIKETPKKDLFGEENETNGKEDASEIDFEVLAKVSEFTSVTPSFCLLDTHRSTCTLYIYTYVNGEVKVDKVTYEKE